MAFFDDDLLLSCGEAKRIYDDIKDLPIIDYHCHLDEKAITENRHFADPGELWLSGDHYKWRAMRLCGVDEEYVTGSRTYKEKFLKYAEVLPKLAGNPLYYWTHMELSRLFSVDVPLNADTAEEVWDRVSASLSDMGAADMLSRFGVEYVATTDDPFSALDGHGDIGGIKVRPTFRPDRCYTEGVDKALLEDKLDFFISKGCKLADHGFDGFSDTSDLEWLIKKCYEKGVILQLHFGTFRNINSKAFFSIGRDSGFDVFRDSISTDALAKLLDKMCSELGGLPKIILYPLNDVYLRAVCAISGAFPNVLVGAAWWFNDTVCGIRRQLETVAEYAVLGTNTGMLTDSRSFSSYVRFDFYRRILASYLGELCEKGEYDAAAASDLARDISYRNIKEALGL